VFEFVLDMLPSEENPTPVVRPNRATPQKRTTVYAKLEGYNPFGAV
jgi:cysteine synthase